MIGFDKAWKACRRALGWSARAPHDPWSGCGEGAPSHPAIELVLDDITLQSTDAIVNAADWTLLGGTGLDGAIHRKAGPELIAHIRQHRLSLPTAGVCSTPGFALAAPWVIHACAPTYDAGQKEAKFSELLFCYCNALALADKMGLSTLCIPLLGAGAFGWPQRQSARSMNLAFKQANLHCRNLKIIRAVAFSDSAMMAMSEALGIAGQVALPKHARIYDPGFNALSRD